MRALAVLLLCALPLSAANDDRAVVTELATFLAIPNLASDAANIRRSAEVLKGMMERRGIATQILTVGDAPPLVVGEWRAAGPARTIAFYAHYDGQPVDASQWKSAPWAAVMRDGEGRDVPDWANAERLDPDWRLYGRSASDDKAPIVAMLAAVDRLRAKGARPGVNVLFVFEGEEEAGSPNLARYLREHADILRPDAWILCDGPVHQSRRAQLAFGARGVIDLDLVVYGPIRGLHDGHYGNWVPNPIVRLAHLLTSMRDEQGTILIDGFYDEVVPPTREEKAAIAAMPPVEAELRRQFQIRSSEGGLLGERILLPALNVRGIQAGGVGEKASNTIQTTARASIDFRLVPAQTPESVRRYVERHLQTQGWTIVRDEPDAEQRLAHEKLVRVQWGAGYPPARTSLDLPLSTELATLMTRAGHEPVRLPTMGGSVPIYLFQNGGKTPAIVLPIANHDNNQHAANENIRLRNLFDAVDIFETLFAELQP